MMGASQLSGHDLAGVSCFEAVLRSRAGVYVRVLVAKYALVGSQYERPREDLHIEPCDRFGTRGELLCAGDLATERSGTTILVEGRIELPENGAPARARVRVGSSTRLLRAFGPRRWVRTSSGFEAQTVGAPEAVPLDFAHAFGGPGFPANPIGKGFVRAGESPEGVALPELEDDTHLIGSPEDRPPPAAIAAVAPAWEPRCAVAGTYDEVWKTTRAPALPDDCDPSIFDPGSWVIRPGLRGSEEIEVSGISGVPLFRRVLPRPLLRCRVGNVTLVPTVDALTVDPARDRLVVTLRFVLPPDASRVAPVPWIMRELRLAQRRDRLA